MLEEPLAAVEVVCLPVLASGNIKTSSGALG